MKLIIKNYMMNLLNILYLEIIYHILIFKSFSINEVFFILLFSLINTLIIDIVCSITKNKNINKWLNIFINSFLSILFIAYFTNFKFYGNTLSIYSIFHGVVSPSFARLTAAWLHRRYQVGQSCIPNVMTYCRLYRTTSHRHSYLRFRTLSLIFLSSDSEHF